MNTTKEKAKSIPVAAVEKLIDKWEARTQLYVDYRFPEKSHATDLCITELRALLLKKTK